MSTNNTPENIRRVADLLESHGFRIEVGGCGCCGSPWLKLEYQGELILDDSSIELDMFKEKP